MKSRIIICAVAAALALFGTEAKAQTSYSLFWRTDSLQVRQISATDNSQYKKVGHHGPAVENKYMALRMYFNDTGAIDIYSKSGNGLELLKYLWYPKQAQQKNEGAGCDEYFVGKTTGLGGIRLWDGEKEVPVKIGSKRIANVGPTENGSYAELITYGVPYKGGKVDISLRIDTYNDSRIATVTASCLSGQKVQFVTGVNFNDDAVININTGHVSVWGKHPANVSQDPQPIGGGICFDSRKFSKPEMVNGMVRIISEPTTVAKTAVVSASVKESWLNTADKFKKFVRRMKAPRN